MAPADRPTDVTAASLPLITFPVTAAALAVAAGGARHDRRPTCGGKTT